LTVRIGERLCSTRCGCRLRLEVIEALGSFARRVPIGLRVGVVMSWS
jgi:hypothetical protein